MDATFIFWAYLVINLMLSGLVAYAASEKGRDALGFFGVSFLFSFIVGILILLAVPNRTPVRRSTQARRGEESFADGYFDCPACAEEVRIAAKICKHCGVSVEEQSQQVKMQMQLAAELYKQKMEEENKKVQAERAKRSFQRKALLQSIFSKKNLFLKLLFLIGVSVVISSLLLISSTKSPVEEKTSYIPATTSDLEAKWLSSLKTCGFSPEPGAENFYELQSGKLIWEIIRTNNSLILRVVENVDKTDLECVSQEVFATSIDSVAIGKSLMFQNGYSQGLDTSSDLYTGLGDFYYFRWVHR